VSGAASRVLAPVAPDLAKGARRLARLKEMVPARADLVLVGDSLAAGFPDAVLGASLPGVAVFNFGLPGDRVQNTLWRLDAFDLAHLEPRAVVLLLGTNNLGDGDPAEEVAGGLAAVVERLLARWPGARLLLLTVPWREERPGYADGERRRLNGLLAAAWVAHPRVDLLDTDAALHGSVSDPPALEPDGLHLSEAGYRRLSAALARRLDGIA
jgi:lysophospholipase L1-like esterase